ncbi:AraC family transcriptional regulator [Vibrio algarum]|uniref:AraC family transcriptional regulator n=1 Tax=Vibrio algarum TaxID=3020714 RepID=A0ABT4YQ58_9VIBR|nr:AraC family transcriptional regulator [Vibrio sp. KJ40-1]MDB1123510.1 AraC family transcriptional regulator [Vibrio sp. KJ40-1]
MDDINGRKNSHKFHSKEMLFESELLAKECANINSPLNYSRTLGASQNWIGCGYIHKPGVETEHINVKFPFFSLVYVIRGTGSYTDENGKRHLLSPGSIFQRRPKVMHTTVVTPNSDWQEYYLDCNEELYEHLSSMSLINKDIAVYDNAVCPGIKSDIESLMAQLQNANEEEVFDAYLRFLSIIRTLLTSQDEVNIPNDMITESLTDFEVRYATRFDLKEYCSNKGWGYEKFRKTFKKHMGVSPREYLIRKRMDEACRLLRASKKRISVIASELGYASQYEFSNQFSKYFKVAPKHYREGV